MILADAQEDPAGNAQLASSESSVCWRGRVAAHGVAATQRWRARAAGAAGVWCWRVKAPLPVYPWYSWTILRLPGGGGGAGCGRVSRKVPCMVRQARGESRSAPGDRLR